MIAKKDIEERIKWLESWIIRAKNKEEENECKFAITQLEWVIEKMEGKYG